MITFNAKIDKRIPVNDRTSIVFEAGIHVGEGSLFKLKLFDWIDGELFTFVELEILFVNVSVWIY